MLNTHGLCTPHMYFKSVLEPYLFYDELYKASSWDNFERFTRVLLCSYTFNVGSSGP